MKNSRGETFMNWGQFNSKHTYSKSLQLFSDNNKHFAFLRLFDKLGSYECEIVKTFFLQQFSVGKIGIVPIVNKENSKDFDHLGLGFQKFHWKFQLNWFDQF